MKIYTRTGDEGTTALFGGDRVPKDDARTRARIPTIDDDDVARLEAMIDETDAQIEPLRQFILPGGHQASAALQVARAVARRAERDVVTAARDQEINPAVRIYLNRLSDLLFVLARYVNAEHGVSESRWKVKNRLRPE